MKKVQYILILGFICFLILLMPIAYADMSPPTIEGVEFQGTKIVSEEGYFYVEITNRRATSIMLTLESDIVEVETNQTEIYLHLEPSKSTRLYFHAPKVPINNQIDYYFMHLTERDEEYYISTLRVAVVSLVTDITFSNYGKYIELKDENEKLKEDNNILNTQISSVVDLKVELEKLRQKQEQMIKEQGMFQIVYFIFGIVIVVYLSVGVYYLTITPPKKQKGEQK